MSPILIVDDSALARKMTQRCLEMAGWSGGVLEASNGKEALDMVRAQEIAGVLVDLNMPVMDGRTFLRHVRASPKMFGVFVGVISSIVNDASKEELQRLGATLIVRKPVSPDLLIPMVETLARGGGHV